MPISGGGGAGSASSVALLSNTVLGADGTFDITSISSAYNDLILVLIARDTTGGGTNTPGITFNGDAGANYYNERQNQVGTTTTVPAENSGGSQAGVGRLPGSTTPANNFGYVELRLFGYAATTWLKTYWAASFWLTGTSSGGMNVQYGGGLWNSTAAINRVTITGLSAANFLAGSQLRVYGRK